MKRVAACFVVAFVACGPGLPPENPKERGRNALADASGNETAIRQMLVGSVTNAGLWFPDSECVTQFPVAAPIPADHLDAFAHCLATLHWQPSTRIEHLADVVVLTYPPGFEIEARVVPELSGPRIQWIGFVSRRDNGASLPSVTPETLDALRTEGDRDGPLDPAVAGGLELDIDPSKQAYAWFHVCLDAEGNVAGTHLRKETSPKAGDAFASAATHWKFKPFSVAGRPLPVCSLVRMAFPSSASGDADNSLPLPLPPSVAFENVAPVEVPPKALEAHRISGSIQVEPDAQTKTDIHQGHRRRIIGTFRLCLNAHGHVELIDTLRSTGYASYDRDITHTMRSWVYSPLILDDKPAPVCSAITYIYNQD